MFIKKNEWLQTGISLDETYVLFAFIWKLKIDWNVFLLVRNERNLSNILFYSGK